VQAVTPQCNGAMFCKYLNDIFCKFMQYFLVYFIKNQNASEIIRICTGNSRDSRNSATMSVKSKSRKTHTIFCNIILKETDLKGSVKYAIED